MTLRQLSYFVCIVKLGSFTQAARRLAVAQSALSRQMQLLEAEVGVPLLQRSGQGVKLTRQGRELLPLAQEIDRLVQSARGLAIRSWPGA
ncbi:LysR family transcriptional regulator [Thiomonas sp. FB-6]|uniref:LysR family transcriptional regulator n=1 Tax=Thiomonas sp. FB-6 TaxID=1158291 RepID=UPI0003705343|nr:LysR family transcriptional regulator [Thiomonas sp. FB-6]